MNNRSQRKTNEKKIQKKVVWITGGGSGLGKAMALEFARNGAKVVISGRRENILKETVREIERENSQGLAIQCDVSKEEEIIEAVSQIVNSFGRLDVAIANAAVPMTGKIEELKHEEWKRIFEINVIGLAMTAKHALPELRKTKGRLVLVGSGASMLASPNFSAYTSTKYAMRAIGQTLSMELYKSGVSCTNIYPGYMSTEFAQIDNDGEISSEKQKWDNSYTWSPEKSAQVCINPKLKDLKSISDELRVLEESIRNLIMQKNQLKKDIEILTEQKLDKKVLIEIYSDFKKLFDDFNFEEKQTAVRLLIREIELKIHKDHPEDAKIKMALWNYTTTEPILLTELNSSSLRRIRLHR
ncbi:SDR family oxidoreductase [Bacteroidota bacterium]